jgi:hypothetical protein
MHTVDVAHYVDRAEVTRLSLSDCDHKHRRTFSTPNKLPHARLLSQGSLQTIKPRRVLIRFERLPARIAAAPYALEQVTRSISLAVLIE